MLSPRRSTKEKISLAKQTSERSAHSPSRASTTHGSEVKLTSEHSSAHSPRRTSNKASDANAKQAPGRTLHSPRRRSTKDDAMNSVSDHATSSSAHRRASLNKESLERASRSSADAAVPKRRTQSIPRSGTSASLRERRRSHSHGARSSRPRKSDQRPDASTSESIDIGKSPRPRRRKTSDKPMDPMHSPKIKHSPNKARKSRAVESSLGNYDSDSGGHDASHTDDGTNDSAEIIAMVEQLGSLGSSEPISPRRQSLFKSLMDLTKKRASLKITQAIGAPGLA